MSIVEVCVLTFTLLSSRQRREAFTNIMLSFLQASFEVISVAAVIPIFLKLIDTNVNIKFSFLSAVEYLPWSVIVIGIVFVFILKNLISLWISHSQSQFIHKIFINFSEELYRRFYHQEWTYFTRDNSAEIVRKIKHTPSDFANYVLLPQLTLITDIAICSLMTLILVWVDYSVILVIFVLAAPLIGIYYWFRRTTLVQINQTFRDLTPKANIVLTQGIDSFGEAKLYNRENYFIDHFMVFNKITSEYLSKLRVSTSLPSRIFEIVGVLCLVALIVFSKFAGSAEGTSQLVVIMGLFSIAMYRIIPSLNRILINLSQIKAYSYSVTELKESFNTSMNRPTSVKNEAVNFDKFILLKTVAFKYNDKNSGDKFLFKELSIKINKGDFVLLEGPSGAGKTTLIHILAGLITGYEGDICIDNKRLTDLTLKSWQCKIGFVPQAAIVLQDTILKNIAFGLQDDEIDMARIDQALIQANLYDFVCSTPLKYFTEVGENGLTLSGGQRQRLILARALYRTPELLLLDEVTNQLDAVNRETVLSSLKDLSTKGITIIAVSHDPASRKYANKILRLDEGQISIIAPNQSSLIG